MNRPSLFAVPHDDQAAALPAPYGHASTTSKTAAKSAQASTQQRRVFDFIRGCGEHGATDAEGQATLGIVTQSYTPRRGALVQLGLVRDSGRTRLTPLGKPAAVWVATGMPYGAGCGPQSSEDPKSAGQVLPAPAGDRCPRCRSIDLVEVQISGGRTRFDCRNCGRFVKWGRWS